MSPSQKSRPPRSVPLLLRFILSALAAPALDAHPAYADDDPCPDPRSCGDQVLLLNHDGKTLLRYAPMKPDPIPMSLLGCRLAGPNRQLLSSGADLLVFGPSDNRLGNGSGRLCRIGQGQSLTNSAQGDGSIGAGFDVVNSGDLAIAWMDASHLAVLEQPGKPTASVRFYDALPHRTAGTFRLFPQTPLGWPSNEVLWPGATMLSPTRLINAGTAQLLVTKTSQDRLLRLTAVEGKAKPDVSEVKLSYLTNSSPPRIRLLLPLAPAPLNIIAEAPLARQLGAVALLEDGGPGHRGIAFIPAAKLNMDKADEVMVLDQENAYIGAAVAWGRPPLDLPAAPGTEPTGVLITSYYDSALKKSRLAAAVLKTAAFAKMQDGETLIGSRVTLDAVTRFDNVAIIPMAPPSRYFPLEPPTRYAVLAFSGAQASWYELQVPAGGGPPVWGAAVPMQVATNGLVLSGHVLTALKPLLSLGRERLINLAVGNDEEGARLGNLPFVAPGSSADLMGSKRTLSISAGDCTATSVSLVAGKDANKPSYIKKLLSPPDTSYRSAVSVPDPGDSLWLRFTQSSSAAEDCTFRLTSTDTVSMYATEGLVQIQGGKLDTHALALVLDTSASMKRPIAGMAKAAIYDHMMALDGALRSFAAVLSLIPDAQAMDIFLVPFNSDAGVPRKTTGGQLQSALSSPQFLLTPTGETNILAGLRRATAALADPVQTTKAHKSVMLLTDGQHNFSNGQSVSADELEPLSESQDQAQSASQLLRQAKIESFFSWGISPYAEHAALNRLARRATGSPNGGSNYSTQPSFLESTFLQTLWRLLSASFLLRTDGMLPGMNSESPGKNIVRTPVDVTQADREIFITAVGGEADSQLALTVRLNGKPLTGNGSVWCVPRLAGPDLPNVGAKFVACRIAQDLIPGLAGQLDIELANLGLHPTRYRLEVTARSNLWLSSTFSQGVNPEAPLVTGAPVTMDVMVRSYNLGVSPARVTARLYRTERSLGDLMADDSLNTASLQLQQPLLTEDTTQVMTKLQRLLSVAPNSQVKGEAMPLSPVGTDAASQGLYRLVFEPQASGPYEIEVTVERENGHGGTLRRSQFFSTYIEPGLDCARSVQQYVRSKDTSGAEVLTLVVQPQDGRSSFLGPGNGAALHFEQPGNPSLRWTAPADDETLTGRYSVALTNVIPAPLFMVTLGGRCEVKEPSPDTGTPQCASGCCCQLGAHDPGPSSASAWGALLLLTIYLLRRSRACRRTAHHGAHRL